LAGGTTKGTLSAARKPAQRAAESCGGHPNATAKLRTLLSILSMGVVAPLPEDWTPIRCHVPRSWPCKPF
jgi:hypothetical protein